MSDSNGAPVKLARKDFQSDQEVRWCPGCGDYGILTAIQLMLPDTGIKPEDLVFVSGIGCAARLPYYMNTYGIHSIHGRAPAVATGVALARPDLHVWVIGGDGDMLSIGGNHLIHALRRNVNIKILMFNNQIYGLTKGQYSPTSEMGKVTKSTPFGSLDHPFNPISVALGAEATFVARTHDMDRKHMTEVFTPGQRASRRRVRRGVPELQRVQRRRVRHDPQQRCPPRHVDQPAARRTDPFRHRPASMGVVINEHGEAQIVASKTSTSDASSSTTNTATIRRLRSRCHGSPNIPRPRHRSACSGPSTVRRTRSKCNGSSSPPPNAAVPATSPKLLRSAPTWTVN